MKRIYLSLALVVLVTNSLMGLGQNFHYAPAYEVTQHGKYGFMDSKCQVIIPIQFDATLGFAEGLASVEMQGKWGYIDESGSFAIAPQFPTAFPFSEGLASVRPNEHSPLFGFIDKTGTVVIKPQFGMPLFFHEGLVEGYGEENRVLNIPLGYVDKSGKYVIHLHEPGMAIQFLVGFSEGLARVSMWPAYADGRVGTATWGYIDHEGRWVIPRSFLAADDFHEGLAAVADKNGVWGYIDKAGKFVIAPQFEGAQQFSGDLAAVRVSGKWGFINRQGELVIAPQFEKVGIFKDGMAVIGKGRKSGYIDRTGRITVPPTLDSAGQFSDGLAQILTGSTYGVLDPHGKVLCKIELGDNNAPAQ